MAASEDGASTGPLGLMCVHAHPDDEATSTGGILARYADEGLRTAVVTCTGGERGEIHNMDVETTRPRLAEVRCDELTRALTILGAGAPRYLGYVDSDMMGREGNADPACFWQASVDEAVGRLVAQIREFRPDVLTTYDAFGGYGHPDHLQTHRVAVLAAEAASIGPLYPEAGAPWRIRKVYLSTFAQSTFQTMAEELTRRGIPLPFDEDADDDADADAPRRPPGTPDRLIAARVDATAYVAIKRAALDAHASQLDPESFFMTMPADVLEMMFKVESFLRLRSDVAVEPQETDLFAGLG
jgi:mycothiol conjugate amidase Mca